MALADLGLRGPRSDWRLEALPALAASGALHVTGFPDLPPTNAPGFLAHDCASVYGAIAAVAGVLDAERHGERSGQSVDISVQEAALAGTGPWSIALHTYSKLNPLLSPEGKRNAEGAYWVLPAGDGWVRSVIGSPRQWNGFVELMGSPEALQEDVWNSMLFRLQNADVVRILAEDLLSDRTRAQLFDEALERSTTVGVLHTLREFADHPQTRSRGFFADTGWPGLEGLPFARHPVNLSRTPASLRHPLTIESEAAFRPRQRPAGEPIGKGRGLLLEGVRVVEFGVAAVSPELCGVLSELGADVIKVESRAHLDVLRAAGGPFPNRSMTFNCECRGRRSVVLDLTTEKGRELAFELCAGADVVAENYRGGVLDALGLGYDAVRARNPRVIYASSQGYGRTGPFGQMPAYGPLNSGFSGVHLLWNHPDAPYPCGTSMNHPDHIAGKLLAVSVLAALRERREQRRGAVAGDGPDRGLRLPDRRAVSRRGATPAPTPSRSATPIPPRRRTASTPAPEMTVGWPSPSSTDEHWQRLCKVVGWDAHGEFGAAAARVAARLALDERLSEWTRLRGPAEAAEILQAAGVSAMPVMGPVDHHARSASAGARVHRPPRAS